MAKTKIEMNVDIPPLEGFQPMSPPKAYLEVLNQKDYGLQPLEEFAGINIAAHKKEVEEKMKGMDSSMMIRGESRYFCTDKIEKISFGWSVIRKALVAGACMGWPRDDYDFPILTLDWDESLKHVHIIADFMPLTDIVMNDWYREKYLDGIEPIYKQYTDLLDAPPNPINWFRSLSSPYVISGKPDADPQRTRIKRAQDCLVVYFKYWLDEIVAKAEPIKDPAHKEYVNKRKAKMRDVLRRKDPGGAPIAAMIGKELAFKGLTLLF
jgi:hypothetical protein